ncbi:hypothetical protein EV677_2964 [Herminiimonas fonticola]|uniref:DUF6969 domain-containing protein n=2 Tax=Herminiimonas fonticola TaxID=303380 RepID=A0A4R6G1Q9_9BURK|nr:hypothetical protein EV677_2964 [Herminiimonas fonticola]
MAHQTPQQISHMQSAAEALLACYAELAADKSHLLSEILDDSVPRQWAHYPDDDVIDHAGGYQFFYHSHSPEDRDATAEHGHFHVFARQDVHGTGVDPNAEQEFLKRLNGELPADANTIHLLCVALDAKGVPTALFTVNRWVTGDHLLSAETTLRLLSGFSVHTQHELRISKWLTALLALFRPQIEQLLMERDKALWKLAEKRRKSGLLEDKSVELLSSIPIDIDLQINWLFSDENTTGH